MDKRVIFAVAGSGKTSNIIGKLTLDKRFLLITYTINNQLTLRNRIIKRFGYLPDNIKLLSYFAFLYSFCYKPFLAYKIKSKGINWNLPPPSTRYVQRDDLNFYLDKNRRLYHNRIANLCIVRKILSDINKRIEKYYDFLSIDEIQDFAGHDFNLLKSIAQANCDMLFVGDFYQHTFDTSTDGNVNKGLFDNYDKYKKRFQSMGLVVDTTSLCNSYRCSKSVCNFIKDNLGIEIFSASNKEADIELIKTQAQADPIIKDDSIVKLFYSKHSKYACHSQNWGNSKGIDCFNDVCVVLNKTTKRLFNDHQLSNLKPQTKNKFYVACSRARGKLYLMPDKFVKSYEISKK